MRGVNVLTIMLFCIPETNLKKKRKCRFERRAFREELAVRIS